MYRPAKDEPAVTESDLSRQLHSSVRTPNLETSLRLLSQGADPNYYHPEKNSTPLQVTLTEHNDCKTHVQGYHSACDEPTIDFITKVPVWPGLAWPNQAKAELLF